MKNSTSESCRSSHSIRGYTAPPPAGAPDSQTFWCVFCVPRPCIDTVRRTCTAPGRRTAAGECRLLPRVWDNLSTDSDVNRQAALTKKSLQKKRKKDSLKRFTKTASLLPGSLNLKLGSRARCKGENLLISMVYS